MERSPHSRIQSGRVFLPLRVSILGRSDPCYLYVPALFHQARRLQRRLAVSLRKAGLRPMRVIGVIPARYKSSRLEGKPLADIHGKSMVQHVYERARLAKNLDDVLVATDDERIYRAVVEFGGKA